MDDKNVRRRFRASNYQVDTFNKLIPNLEYDQSKAIYLHNAYETG